MLKTRKGRAHGRPLDTKNTMHLVLRSTKAKGQWSFRHKGHPMKIKAIVDRFALKYGIKIISLVNVGNHLHMQIKLGNRFTYDPFIRSITSSIAMAVTGVSRWSERASQYPEKLKFWDYRPFTRVIIGWRAVLGLKDYFEINKWEGFGFNREMAKVIIAERKLGEKYWDTA